ncbi:MAG: hypothetical protein Q4C04_00765 [Clostridia bacterium]|nr:hypothetical protein [Clostridia bacterium]
MKQTRKKRRWGDRKDGRLLRTLDPLSKMSPFIMPNRNGANNLFSDSVEVTEMEHYINRKRKEGLNGFGVMHVIISAYVRTVAQRPGINRFLAGQRVYQRGDLVEVCLAIKKTMAIDAPETVVKIAFAPTDGPEQVHEKIAKVVEESKQAPLESDFDKTAATLAKMPRILMKLAMWFLKLLDYFGRLPASLLAVSPFHGSIFITSMGSLGIPPVYHHLYDFGNIPVFMSFGAKRKTVELRKDGSPFERKYIDLTFNTDERICDGFYYASSIKLFKSLLKNPFKLDTPVDQVVQDID